jgi:hypothetical protein
MFTTDELSIVKIYLEFALDQDSIVSALQDSLLYIDDSYIKSVVTSVIRKTNAMSKEAFSTLDLSEALDIASPEIA